MNYESEITGFLTRDSTEIAQRKMSGNAQMINRMAMCCQFQNRKNLTFTENYRYKTGKNIFTNNSYYYYILTS